jgi:hypothetical protein
MAGARKKVAESAQEPAQPVVGGAVEAAPVATTARAGIVTGEVVRFLSTAGVDCSAVVLSTGVEGVELRATKPSGLTFIAYAVEGTTPGTFQRGV